MMELMVAVGVLLVAVLTAFGSQLTSMNLVSTSRETDTAITELQACMESVLTVEADKIPLASSDYAAGEEIDGYDALSNASMVANYPGFPVGSNDPRDVPDPLEIVLILTWNDAKGRERSMTLTSVKTQ